MLPHDGMADFVKQGKFLGFRVERFNQADSACPGIEIPDDFRAVLTLGQLLNLSDLQVYSADLYRRRYS